MTKRFPFRASRILPVASYMEFMSMRTVSLMTWREEDPYLSGLIDGSTIDPRTMVMVRDAEPGVSTVEYLVSRAR